MPRQVCAAPVAAALNSVYTQIYGQSFEGLSTGSGHLDIAIMNTTGFDAGTDTLQGVTLAQLTVADFAVA